MRAVRALPGISGPLAEKDELRTLGVSLSYSHHPLPFLAPPAGQGVPQPFPRSCFLCLRLSHAKCHVRTSRLTVLCDMLILPLQTAAHVYPH